ncbi:MAG: cytochrome bd-I oxidase subunit CydX [Alphaproteobacteria bacterium]
MWYFTWVLGLAAALSLGIINVMWYEAEESFKQADCEDQEDEDCQV